VNSEAIRPNSAASKSQLLWTLARFAVGIALLAYLASSKIIDFRSLSRLVTAWPVSLVALALIFADIALMALRLSWLARPQDLEIPYANSLELTLVSSFFATFLPGAAGGDLPKLYYAAKNNRGRRAEIVTVVLFDRVMGLLSLLVLPLLFAPLFSVLIHDVPALRLLLIASAALAAVSLAAFLLCLLNRTIPDAIVRYIARLITKFGGRFLPAENLPARILATIRAYRCHPTILAGAFGASLLSNLSMIAVTALAIEILYPGSLSLRMSLVIPMGDIANSLPLTPGGLGVGESAFNALFKLTGLQGGAEALLCWRIWRAVVGLAGLALYLRGPRRSVFQSGKP
jgi:uncharacterized protein (TIRG00374 family)